MESNVKVDAGSIREFSREVGVHGTNFIAILDKLSKEVETINEFFDTTTGNAFKMKLEEQIKSQRKYIEEKYISYSDVVNKIANVYDQTNDGIKKSIG